MIRAVIFDLDGVLVSTDDLHYRAWKQLADAEGIQFDRAINHRLRGVSRMQSLEIILERAARSYSPERKAAMADAKNAAYRDLLSTLTPADALPGADAMLSALQARGVKTAVGSSSRNASLILEKLGWSDRFDAVVDGNDIQHSKPHPEVFVLAAKRLGVPPAQCLVVEDAAAGVDAARRAGMAVFGIGTPDRLPGLIRLAPSLADVSVDDLLREG
ncbi:MAG: beta-phosphoglucomutase [Phycisphaerae bacterium]|nr:beta-phosphoglucomutase [Phycisphaerae bacterium]